MPLRSTGGGGSGSGACSGSLPSRECNEGVEPVALKEADEQVGALGQALQRAAAAGCERGVLGARSHWRRRHEGSGGMPLLPPGARPLRFPALDCAPGAVQTGSPPCQARQAPGAACLCCCASASVLTPLLAHLGGMLGWSGVSQRRPAPLANGQRQPLVPRRPVTVEGTRVIWVHRRRAGTSPSFFIEARHLSTSTAIGLPAPPTPN